MKKNIIAAVGVLFGLALSLAVGGIVSAGSNIGVSPMRESVVLNPGDIYRSSFSVNNPGYSEDKLSYEIEIQPFYVDEDYNPVYTNEYQNGDIANWIKITSGGKGTLQPNDVATVEFEIDVPKDAPAGGQYAAIIAKTVAGERDAETSDGGNVTISEGMAISHVILAEVTGNSISSGDVTDIGVNSFLLGGNITAYSTVENTGNIHGLATYTMKVYPLFSDKPVYNNEEEKEDHYVLPDRKMYIENTWAETPMMGIFNVQYTVEFMGIKSEVTRMVIVCPLWLLFIILLIVAILVIRIVTLVKLQKNRKKEATL